MANYEWKKTQTGRRFVRIKDGGKVAGKVALTPEPAPVETTAEEVAAAEYVPEVKIEDPQQKRGPGRPKKVAPVEVEDADDE